VVGRRGFRGWRFGGGGGRGVRFGIGSLPGRLKGKLLAFLTGCEGEGVRGPGKGEGKGILSGGVCWSRRRGRTLSSRSFFSRSNVCL